MSDRYAAERFINAAKDGYLDLLQKATKRDLNTLDEDGMTPIMWAAHNGHLDAIKLIVGRGGDVSMFDYLGLTALHHASRKGHIHVVTYLVNWGANVFALDNDHHSPLNLASLYEKVEVTQYLDSVCAQQQTKNPKHVARLKEEAVKQAEKNIKRYEKMQDDAARRAEKQQRKLSSEVSPVGEGHSNAPRKQNFFKTLTMRMRSTNSRNKLASKTFGDMAGISSGARGGVAKRISQRREMGANGVVGDGADFKVSDVDESGKRTLRSLSGIQGVRSATSEVMYLTGQRGDNSSIDISTSRPAVYEVFGGNGRPSLFRAKSESNLVDSGTDSYFGDEEEDEENAPGMFNRPGFGKTAFFTGNNFLSTLPSFDGLQDDDHNKALNGLPPNLNGHDDLPNGSITNDPDPGFHGPKELPWDPEEVDQMDDDDDLMEGSSPLEVFLWSAGLEVYLHKFLQEKVDMELLVKMSDNDLKEIGLPFGPRKKLLEAIQRRQDILSRPKVMMTDSFL